MSPDELLLRIAQTLKKDVGPAVESEYPRTQAFLAAAVLEKLARQLRLAPEHAAAEERDMEILVRDLAELARELVPPEPVRSAVESLSSRRDGAALNELIAALYAHRGRLGQPGFDRLLGRVRRSLRASIDRKTAYAS
jgi:hypothetical protein